jgi:tRNA dimethylallyltransferase
MDTGASGFDGEPRLAHVAVGLRRPRRQLYQRINRRVDRMMEQGLLQEVRRLRERLGPQARHALGYKQLAAVLEGEMELPEAVQIIKRDTRHFAKHQMTWYKHFPETQWVDADATGDAEDLAGVVHDRFTTKT